MTSTLRGLATAVALCALAVSIGANDVARAQGITPVHKAAKGKAGKAANAAPAEQKADPAAAEKALENGIKLYQAGKHAAAVQSLDAALKGGGLQSARVARGLYYRGLAYKASGKPAQSISDLTSALWLKGGLDDKERADAQAQRAAAYQEAGLGDAPAVNLPSRVAASARTDAAPAPASAPQATASSSGPLGGVTGFFGNLFGGGSSPAPEAVGANTATGSVHAPAAAEVSSWSSETIAKASPQAPAATPAPAKPAPAVAAAKPVVTASAKTAAATEAAPPAPVTASGKYKLQVAAVRSRAEADAIAARLKKEFGKKLAARVPVVDEAAVGNMGTFYRVRVGPYADANEPRRLCVTLRQSNGFDCLVVTQ